MLSDDVAAALVGFRAHAESLMVDACVVKRPDGTTLDPETLEEVPAYATVYEGPCRVQRSGALGQHDTSPGDYEFGLDGVMAQLPLSATGIERNHIFEVTAVGSISDPELVGFVATVQANLTKTHATKRTLVCEQVAP